MHILPEILITSLKNLGLSNYEARVYAALVLHDAAEVKELIDFLGISKPSVYEGLDRLEEMGLAVKRNSKPAMYSPVRPEIAITVLMDRYSKAAEVASGELKKLEQQKVRTDRSDVVWTVFGDSNIEFKIRSMIRHARKSIECLMADRYLPMFDGVNLTSISLNLTVISDIPDLEEKLKNQMHAKDQHITVLPLKKIDIPFPIPPGLPKIPKIMRLENSLELIIDDQELLSIPPIPCSFVTGMNTTNREMIQHSRALIEGFWGRDINKGFDSKVRFPDPARKRIRRVRPRISRSIRTHRTDKGMMDQQNHRNEKSNKGPASHS